MRFSPCDMMVENIIVMETRCILLLSLFSYYINPDKTFAAAISCSPLPNLKVSKKIWKWVITLPCSTTGHFNIGILTCIKSSLWTLNYHSNSNCSNITNKNEIFCSLTNFASVDLNFNDINKTCDWLQQWSEWYIHIQLWDSYSEMLWQYRGQYWVQVGKWARPHII